MQLLWLKHLPADAMQLPWQQHLPAVAIQHLRQQQHLADLTLLQLDFSIFFAETAVSVLVRPPRHRLAVAKQVRWQHRIQFSHHRLKWFLHSPRMLLRPIVVADLTEDFSVVSEEWGVTAVAAQLLP